MQATDFWNPTFFHHVSLGCLPRVPMKLTSEAVTRCRSAKVLHCTFFQLRNFMNNASAEQWIKRKKKKSGSTARPTPSSDLFPLHFYLWGHLKFIVHDTEVSNAQDLQQRIQNGTQVIRMTPGILRRIRQSLF